MSHYFSGRCFVATFISVVSGNMSLTVPNLLLHKITLLARFLKIPQQRNNPLLFLRAILMILQWQMLLDPQVQS